MSTTAGDAFTMRFDGPAPEVALSKDIIKRGLMVAPVLIAICGCMRGMSCGRSASAVGDAATSAVVTSIVAIVLADAVLTFIFLIVG